MPICVFWHAKQWDPHVPSRPWNLNQLSPVHGLLLSFANNMKHELCRLHMWWMCKNLRLGVCVYILMVNWWVLSEWMQICRQGSFRRKTHLVEWNIHLPASLFPGTCTISEVWKNWGTKKNHLLIDLLNWNISISTLVCLSSNSTWLLVRS